MVNKLRLLFGHKANKRTNEKKEDQKTSKIKTTNRSDHTLLNSKASSKSSQKIKTGTDKESLYGSSPERTGVLSEEYRDTDRVGTSRISPGHAPAGSNVYEYPQETQNDATRNITVPQAMNFDNAIDTFPENEITNLHDSTSQVTLYEENPSSQEDAFSMTSEQITLVPKKRINASSNSNYRTVLRKVPIVTILMKNGVFCFSSEKSLNIFKTNKRKMEQFVVDENDEVLGVPLFHCVSYSLIKELFTKNPTTHKIFKFIAVPCNSEGSPILPDNLVNPEFICFEREKKYALFKFEYCFVNENNSFFSNSLTQYLNFQLPDKRSGSKYQATLKSGVFFRYTEAKLSYKPSLKLRWLGTSSLASVFGSLNFKLAVFDHFQDPDDPSTQTERPTILGTWASFSDSSSTIIPKKRIVRCGDVLVGEAAFQNQNVPGTFTQDTEAIICMVFILYDHEIRKERASAGPTGFPMLATGLVF